MYEYRLYNTKDIEQLKQKLEILEINLSDMTDDYRMVKSELFEVKTKLSKQKGELKIMEDNYQDQLVNNEYETQTFSTQIRTINDAVSALQQDITMMNEKFDQIHFSELIGKINHVISKQDDHLQEQKNEIDVLKQDILDLKEHIQPTDPSSNTAEQPTPPKQSEYRQLQNMLQSKSIQQANTAKETTNMPHRKTQAPGSFSSAQNVMQAGKGKKSHRDPQYDRTIITHSTAKDKQEKKKIDKIVNTNKNKTTATNDHTPDKSLETASENNSKAETYPVENEAEKAETTESNKLNTNDEELPSASKENSPSFSPETTTSYPLATEQDEEQMEEKENIDNTNQQKQSEPKKQNPSFFSIFKKSK